MRSTRALVVVVGVLSLLCSSEALTPAALRRPAALVTTPRRAPLVNLLVHASSPPPPPALGAPQLVAGSALIAALMSLQAGTLAARGVPTVTVAAACGGVAASLCFAFGSARGRGRLLPELPADGQLYPDGTTLPLIVALVAAQSALGGVLPHLAFFSIARSGLAVANCLMFTMPLWTAAFASLLGQGRWTRRDAALSAASMLGVLLVAQPPLPGAPWLATAGSTGTAAAAAAAAAAVSPFSASGFAAGLGFGVCGGLLNVLLGSTALRAASPALLNAWQMVASVAIAAPPLALRLLGASSASAAAAAGAGLLGGVACTPAVLASLCTVGVLMAATSAARTLGLQRASSSSVATLLYTEIAWCFALEVAVLRAALAPLKLAGAALIVGGAAIYAATSS